MPQERRRVVTDVRAFRALANPIRLRILGHLMAVGPQTASQCAAVVDASASNCSYHLRELGRYGLVERVPDAGGDGRERAWRAAATGFSYRVGESGDADPASHLANLALIHAGIDEEAALAHAAMDRLAAEPTAWRDASANATYELRVTAAELEDLMRTLDAAIRPFIGLTRDEAPPDARPVHVSLVAFARPEAPARR
jgi:DNA-binding transcriptional ArsR family regulator